jgi:hypothetical protein
MEQLLAEMREDIKEILTSQARIEERMRAHAQEMHEHKEENKIDMAALKAETTLQIQHVEEKMQPILKSYNGAKWALGAVFTVSGLLAAYSKFF